MDSRNYIGDPEQLADGAVYKHFEKRNIGIS